MLIRVVVDGPRLAERFHYLPGVQQLEPAGAAGQQTDSHTSEWGQGCQRKQTARRERGVFYKCWHYYEGKSHYLLHRTLRT